MGDIWSNVGASLPSTGQDWLYQQEGQIHGPVPKERIVQKLLNGQIDAKTMVAKEGGEFHPISQVAAFAPHLEEFKEKLDKDASKSKKLVIAGVVVVLLLAGGGAGFYFVQEAGKKEAQLKDKHAADKARLEAEAKKRRDLIGSEGVELVALVSFDETAMEVGGRTKSTSRGTRGTKGTKGTKGPKGTAEKEPPMMSSCQRSTGEILGVLKRHLRNINVCVQDEKSRNPTGMPPSIKLSFVAKPTGSVGDFMILDRHFKTGPMRNCMLKAFKLVKFPPTGGTNCPVTIPIKIGG